MNSNATLHTDSEVRSRSTFVLASIGLAAAAPVFVATLNVSSWKPIALLVALLGVMVVIDILENVWTTSSLSLSSSYGAVVVAAILLGPAPAALLALCSETIIRLYEIIDQRRSGPKNDVEPLTVAGYLVNVVTKVWSALLAGICFIAVNGNGVVNLGESTFYLAAALAGIVFALVNFVTVGTLASLLHKKDLVSEFTSNFSDLLHVDTFIILASIAAAALYLQLGIFALALFAIIASVTPGLVRTKVADVRINKEVRKQVRHSTERDASIRAAELIQSRALPENYCVADEPADVNFQETILQVSPDKIREAGALACNISRYSGGSLIETQLNYIMACTHNPPKQAWNIREQRARPVGGFRRDVRRVRKRVGPEPPEETWIDEALHKYIKGGFFDEEIDMMPAGLALAYMGYLWGPGIECFIAEKPIEECVASFFDYLYNNMNFSDYYGSSVSDEMIAESKRSMLETRERLEEALVMASCDPKDSPDRVGTFFTEVIELLVPAIEERVAEDLYQKRLPEALEKARAGKEPVPTLAQELYSVNGKSA